jgi:hypothetical protein
MKLFSFSMLILCVSFNIAFSQMSPDGFSYKEGKWGMTTISQNGNKPRILELNSTTDLKCWQKYTINSNYVCPGINCNRPVKYILISPNDVTISGILPITTISTINGTYTIVLYGMCGTKSCSKCTLKFTTKYP